MDSGVRSFFSEEFLAYWGDVFIRYRLLNSAITFDEFVRDPRRALVRINRLDVLAQIERESGEDELPRPLRPAPERAVRRARLQGWLTSMRGVSRG